MQIATGIEMLEISAPVMGRADMICPTLMWDDDTVVLVDAGYPGRLPLVRQAIESAGVSFSRLSKVILTHHDLDHMGGVPALLSEAETPIEVLAGEAEKPYIQGEIRSNKLTPEAIAQALASLPDGVPDDMRQRFKAVLENPPRARVDRTLADDEELPYCGGVVVIATPGHTPGHICLYHRQSKTLIAGDALRVAGGQLLGPLPEATPDLEQAIRSLEKLAQYDIAGVICYHGGLYGGRANVRIAELAREGTD